MSQSRRQLQSKSRGNGVTGTGNLDATQTLNHLFQKKDGNGVVIDKKILEELIQENDDLKSEASKNTVILDFLASTRKPIKINFFALKSSHGL